MGLRGMSVSLSVSVCTSTNTSIFSVPGVDIVHLISDPFPSVWHEFTDDWEHLDFAMIDDFSRVFRVFVSSLMQLQLDNASCHRE